MSNRYLLSVLCSVIFATVLTGCTPVVAPVPADDPDGFTRLTDTDGGTGFVDGGGFFTVGAGTGTIVPFEPEAVAEVATDSFFAARSIDPFSEDSAGPKFVTWGYIDDDGLPDLVTVWNQSQVVQLQLQRQAFVADVDEDGVQIACGSDVDCERNRICMDGFCGRMDVTFESVQIDGNAPIAIMAGVELADVDRDGRLDIVLLVKHNASLPFCPGNGAVQEDMFVGEIVILFAPTGGDITVGGNWQQVRLPASIWGADMGTDALPPDTELTDAETDAFFAALDDNFPGIPFGDGRAIDLPENGGMTSLAVGDVTGDGFPDILLTSNVPEPPCHNGVNEVELYPNPGATARTGTDWTQVILSGGGAFLKDIVLDDIDGDGDLDVFVTRVNAVSQNVHWLSNPLRRSASDPSPPGVPTAGFWELRPVGQIDGGADVMTIGDVDGDGLGDVVVRSNGGKVVQWFRHPSPDDALNVTDVIAGIPWSVYTLFELVSREPVGIALGDINFDNQLDLLLAADGSTFWLDSSTAATVFDEWSSNLIVDDLQLDTSLFAPSGPAFINDLLVLDIDCDGANDVIGTIDRRSLSGLSTDVVVWFRNVLLPQDVGLPDTARVPGCPPQP